MPAQKGAGAFLLGRMNKNSAIKALVVFSFFAAALSAFFQPFQAFATDFPDPVPGRGWTCEGNRTTVDTWGTPVKVGTITCRDPNNPNNSWQETCPDSGGFIREVAIGADVMDCRITVTQNGESQTYQGDRVRHTVFGYQPIRAVLTPGTGVPSGEVEEGEQTNLLSFGGDQVGNIALETVATIIWFITEILVWVADFLLSVTGGFFNFIITEFVIQMAKYITAPEATAVRTAWTLIRDLANIGIIGGLVATAIGTIIGSSKINIQGTLARLILAALLVNFSYFFAGAIIDFSNFTAKAAYDSLVVTPNCGNDCGIASRIAKISHLDTDFNQVLNGAAAPLVNASRDTEAAPSWADQVDIQQTLQPSAMATINIMYLIFVCITTFVFLSAIALLVGRFVVLIFLLVTSPIGIAGSAVPLLSKYSKEWWDALWNQALFAPVYFVLAGIALNILTQFNNTLLGAGYATTIETITDTSGATVDSLQQIIGIVAMFTVSIGFMWAALSIAKSMSEKGASYFKPIYDAAQKAFGWLPASYQRLAMFAPKAAAFGIGVGLRETLGKRAYEAGIAYRKLAGELRPDQAKGVLGGVARAGDRAIKAALDKAAGQKFLGAKGYHDIHEERKARRAELGEVEREGEQRGLAEGKLTKNQLDEWKKMQARKAGGITEEEEKRLKELEEKEKKGTLGTDEALLLQELRQRRANAKDGGLTDKEKAELASIEAKKAAGEALTAQEEARLTALNERKKYGGVDAKDQSRYDDYAYVEKHGGVLNAFKTAEDNGRWLRKNAEYRNINEVEHYDKLKAKAAAGETLSENEKQALAFYEKKEKQAAQHANLSARKARGEALTPDEEKELADLERQKEAGILGLQKKARESDDHAGYWARVEDDIRNAANTPKSGLTMPPGVAEEAARKRTESLTSYYERMEKTDAESGGSGVRKALSKLQAIEAQLPNGFIQRLYDEHEHHPQEFIKWAPMLNSNDFNELMKNEKIPRDIKDEMRKQRHGEWMDMIEDLDAKVRSGEILEGSDEYNELQSIAYRYSMKRFKDKGEFSDLITSRVGEHLRKMRTMWNGGALTGMYLGSRGAFGAYEQRDLANLKREGYLKHQRALTGAYAVQGMADVYNDDGSLKDSYYMPVKPDSDNFFAIEESWKDADTKIKEAERVLANENASAQARIAAQDQKRYYGAILETKDKNYAQDFKGAFGAPAKVAYEAAVRAGKSEQEARAEAHEARMQAVREKNAQAKEMIRKVKDNKMSKAEADAFARGDEQLFISYRQQLAEEGMNGFMLGKDPKEELQLVSPERAYSPATVIGKTASAIAQMQSGWDERWIRANRRSYLVEKEDPEIELFLNDNVVEKMGGWPTRDEIDEINELRRQKYGPLYGDTLRAPDGSPLDPETADPNAYNTAYTLATGLPPDKGRMRVPYSNTELGQTKLERRGQV